jgi:hypothetical protein
VQTSAQPEPRKVVPVERRVDVLPPDFLPPGHSDECTNRFAHRPERCSTAAAGEAPPAEAELAVVQGAVPLREEARRPELESIVFRLEKRRLEAVRNLSRETRVSSSNLMREAITDVIEKHDPSAGAKRWAIGNCGVRCRLTGKPCELPPHAPNVNHRHGRTAFTAVADPGQTTFDKQDELDAAASSRFGEAMAGA